MNEVLTNTQTANAEEQNLFEDIFAQEEKGRAQSLAFLAQNLNLNAELRTVENTIRLFMAITQDYQANNNNHGLLIHLGIRLTNAALSSIKLAMSGYYQQAYALSRDLTETGYLLHYLCTTPGAAATWRTASEKDRKRQFAPIAVRKALDAAEGETAQKRARVYSDASRYAAHVTPESFNMLMTENTLWAGPFFRAEYLTLCVRELFVRLCPAAHILVCTLPDLPQAVRTFHDSLMTEFRTIADQHEIA